MAPEWMGPPQCNPKNSWSWLVFGEQPLLYLEERKECPATLIMPSPNSHTLSVCCKQSVEEEKIYYTDFFFN